MGITSPVLPDENTISGNDSAPFDPVADPEDDGVDVRAFANFMRATKAPSRGPLTQAVVTGERIFASTGCNTCHVGLDHHGGTRHGDQWRWADRSASRWQQGHPPVQ